MRSRTLFPITLGAALLASAAVQAKTYPEAEKATLELSRQAIALRSVRGEGNETPKVAELFRDALIEGGWDPKDIEIVPHEDTAYLIATWRGSDPSLGPVVVSAHMDVVEAKPEDWERDPFTPVVENGYLYGRGASDTKFDAVLAMEAMIELRRQGFQPKRSLVIALSGDEETTMDTSKLIAERLRDARIVLNVDGASGTLSEETGKPLYWSWQGGEKTYIDYKIEITNPGGHSSMPRPDNAIVQMSQVLDRIGHYNFKPELNDITREYWIEASKLEPDAELAAAMKAFVADPDDAAALRVLRANPSMVGRIGTTCVPTLISGGHAQNALPQNVTANINCRIFPGHSRTEIMAELEKVAAEPAATFSDVTGDDSVMAPASPMDPEFVKAVRKAVTAAWGPVPIIPMQSSGASDSMWYRALGVPSYGASATMLKESDEFAHGLNEREPLVNIRPGIVYYLSLYRDLAGK
ncbi:M20/M25/M40 family metallo-hydrolase [Novosphingobium mangrovi (ex Huang et al. 2023)]|uniref:M20/M25/M40 family metallo-hydrolase n=1 Tax=Novosphingobium mangrovi (ex Huang et al. 2023) TaxID=2976432 RepID=A0ABT2I4J6_9SPHN|nr:M20/M25/M40 family metallo-hydrolase [Novosphingobium mangrovi (ex Huang et al. 2023)]MCT2399553.1 M20/M25/M40 family metallo-hydrolase [Novosphingobium mangrovi (ex Huang et al. 2023)]